MNRRWSFPPIPYPYPTVARFSANLEPGQSLSLIYIHLHRLAIATRLT